MLSRPFAIALLTVCIASPLSSQRLTQRAGISAPTVTTTTARPMWLSSRRDVPSNNWLRGTLIGGGIGLAIGYILARPGDSDSPGATRFMLGTAFFGAVIGAFIGSASKRHS